MRLRGDSNFDLDSRLQIQARNLFDNFTRRMQIDQTLVNLQFITVPGFGPFTTRRFTGGNFEDFGGESDGAFDSEVLVFSSVD